MVATKNQNVFNGEKNLLFFIKTESHEDQFATITTVLDPYLSLVSGGE